MPGDFFLIHKNKSIYDSIDFIETPDFLSIYHTSFKLLYSFLLNKELRAKTKDTRTRIKEQRTKSKRQ